MTDEALTVALAEQILGWKAAPDRFIKSGRKWLPRWRFAPLMRLDDAFELLGASNSSYKLTHTPDGDFSAEVKIGGRTGKASGQPNARTITVALARAIGLEVQP